MLIGLAAGANYQNIARYLEEAIDTDEGRTELQEKLIKSIEGMKSPCEFREGTFLANSKLYDEYCMAEKNSQQSAYKKGACLSVNDDQKQSRDADMRTSATSTIENIKVDGERTDPTCNVDESTTSESDSNSTIEIDLDSTGFSPLIIKGKISTEKFYPLSQMSEPYRTLLRDFYPEDFESLNARTFILKPENPMLMPGITTGPVSIVCDHYVLSPHGQFYLMGFAYPLDEIQLEQLMKGGDKEKIKYFINAMSIVAHEFSHVRNVANGFHVGARKNGYEGFEDFCSKNGLPSLFKEELIAYFMDVKVIEVTAQQYPVLLDIIEEVANEEPIEIQMSRLSKCEIKKEEWFRLMGIQESQLQARALTAYLRARKSGQWKEFKDVVMNWKLMEQFGLPYIFAGLNRIGEQACLSSLNREFESIMNDDSPEKLLQK